MSSAPKSNPDGLTPEQERFCRARAAGLSQGEAYAKANPRSTASAKSQSETGCKLESLEKVQKRLAELRAHVEAGAIADLKQIQADLIKMATDESKPDGVRLKAYDQAVRMQGGYKDQVDHDLKISLDDRRDAITRLLSAPPVDE